METEVDTFLELSRVEHCGGGRYTSANRIMTFGDDNNCSGLRLLFVRFCDSAMQIVRFYEEEDDKQRLLLD